MIYGTEPERALTLIDSARIVGNIDEYSADYLRARVYANSVADPRPNEAIALCEQLLQQDSTKAESASQARNRADVLQVLIDACRRKQDDELWLKYAIERAQLCREWGKETEALRIDADIALILTHLGRSDEGMAKLDAVILALGEGKPSVDRLDASIVAIKRKISMLEEQDRQAEIIPMAEAILRKIDAYRSHPSSYAEDSDRLPPIPEDRERYCAFCQAQAWGFLARANARSTPTDLTEVRKYTQLFEQSDYGHTYGGWKMISPAWKVLGQWDKVLAVVAETEARMGDDTLNAVYATLLRDRAEAASAQGRNGQALDYMNRYSALQHQVNRQLQETQAHEYAARYHADEQDRKIREAETRAATMAVIVWSALILLILATAAALVYARQHKKIDEKNRALVRMINDQADARKTAPSESDFQLFRTIDQTIREERLYADESLQRQDILDRFNISRRTLGVLLTHFANGKSFPTYINELRMHEAVSLLRENPEMTLTEIAETVGFTLPTFRDRFKREYGMTPTEFRQNL